MTKHRICRIYVDSRYARQLKKQAIDNDLPVTRFTRILSEGDEDRKKKKLFRFTL